MHTAPRSFEDERGFTLVELVVVIGLTAILAGISGPKMFGASDFDSSRFYDESEVALRYAQKLAIATSCGVQFNIAAGAWTLNQEPGCTGGSYTLAVTHPATGASGYSQPAPAGVAFSSTVNPLRFTALGRATNSSGTVSGATITIGSRTLTVIGETGLVRR